MPGDYIPSTDAGLLSWSANFDNLITSSPTTYGLIAGQATAYATLHSAYDSAYTVAVTPASRNAGTIAAKDTARIALVAKARELANIVQNDPDTTNTHRADLGLTLRDSVPTPIGAPTSKPVASVDRILNLSHVLRIRDEFTPTSNARPAGSIGAEVWMKVGATPPVSVADCDYVGLATRVPYSVSHDPANAGEEAHFIIRWINARGEAGPTADQISATIAA